MIYIRKLNKSIIRVLWALTRALIDNQPIKSNFCNCNVFASYTKLSVGMYIEMVPRLNNKWILWFYHILIAYSNMRINIWHNSFIAFIFIPWNIIMTHINRKIGNQDNWNPMNIYWNVDFIQVLYKSLKWR